MASKALRKIEFDSRLYSEKSIEKSIEAFKEVCKTYYSRTPQKIIVCLDVGKQEKDADKIVGEFCNFTLGYMKQEMAR